MNKHLLLTIFAILGFNFTFPTSFNTYETLKFDWGKPVTLPYNGSLNLPKPIQIKEDGIIAIQERRTDNLIDYWFHFDESFNKIKSNKMAFNRGSEGNSRQIVDYLVIGDKVHMLYETWKKNSFEHELIRVELKPSGEPTIRKATIDLIYASKEDNIGKFTPILSENKANLLIFNQKPYDKKLNERSSIRVYSTDNWKLAWKFDFDYGHPSAKTGNYIPAISNDGKACFFKTVRDKKNIITQFIYADKDQRKYSHDIVLDGKEFIEIKTGFTKRKEPIAIATYKQNNGKAGKSYGIFFIKLTANGTSVTAQEFIDFAEDKDQINIEMNYDPNDDEVTNGLKLNGFYEKSNGQIIILSEFYQTRKQLINTKDRWIPNNTFEHGNTFIHCLNSEGLVQWQSILNKYQKESSGEDFATFSSVLPYFKKDEIHLLWNSTELVLPFSSWEEQGQDDTIFKKDLFGGATYYPSFMEVFDKNGKKRFGHLKYGLPLANMHTETREMFSLRPDMSFETENGLVILAQASVSPNTFRMGGVDFSVLQKP